MTSHSSELRFIKANMQRQEIAQQIVSQFTVREASVGIISAWSTCLLATSKAKSPWTPKINLRIALIKIFLQLLKLKNERQQLAMCCWIMHWGSRSDFSEESFFFLRGKYSWLLLTYVWSYFLGEFDDHSVSVPFGSDLVDACYLKTY